MKWIKGYLAITTLFFAATAFAIDTGDCQFNCSTLVKIGNTFHVVSRDSDGEIFFTKDTGVKVNEVISGGPTPSGSNTMVTNNSISLKSGAVASASSGGHANTKSYFYETATEYVLVIITEFYDGDGNLIDAQTSTHRTTKPTTPPGPQD